MPNPGSTPTKVTANTGVIVVDHGSRREESNSLLLQIVEALRIKTGWNIVEPAHMELAEPCLETAFANCVAQGAARIVVHPYFLGPGRHWKEDIPRLASEASRNHGHVPFQVTMPLGPHDLLLELVQARVEASLTGDSNIGP